MSSGKSEAIISPSRQVARGLLTSSGTPTTPGQRLPSLGKMRDLKLINGVNIKPSSKTKKMMPGLNLNYERKEQQSESSSSTKVESTPGSVKKKGEFSGRGGAVGGRGRGRGRGNFVQTTGAFSQGVGASSTSASSSAAVSSFGMGGGGGGTRLPRMTLDDREEGGSGGLQVPKLELGHFSGRVDENEEAEIFKELVRDDFIADRAKCDVIPVLLPLVSNQCKVEDTGDVKPKCGVKVKDEPMDVDDLTNGDDDVTAAGAGTKDKFTKVSAKPGQRSKALGEILKSKQVNDMLLFFQLPDCLPRVPKQPASDDAQQPSTSKEQPPQPEATKNGLNPLADYEEGEIGELEVLASGRMRFVLGGVQYEAEEGLQVGCTQDLLSVRLPPDKKTGEISIVGSIKGQLVCSLDPNQLLANLQNW